MSDLEIHIRKSHLAEDGTLVIEDAEIVAVGVPMVPYPGTLRGSTQGTMTTDLTPELTKFFVRSGINVMPPFRKTEITDAELNALAAYLARPGK